MKTVADLIRVLQAFPNPENIPLARVDENGYMLLVDRIDTVLSSTGDLSCKSEILHVEETTGESNIYIL